MTDHAKELADKVRKLSAHYTELAKFADIDYAVEYRDFTRELNKALEAYDTRPQASGDLAEIARKLRRPLVFTERGWNKQSSSEFPAPDYNIQAAEILETLSCAPQPDTVMDEMVEALKLEIGRQNEASDDSTQGLRDQSLDPKLFWIEGYFDLRAALTAALAARGK